MTNHLNPDVRGNQPVGHKRWERAAQWAAAHPDSKAARTYRERVAAADEMERRMPGLQWLHFRRVGRDTEYIGQTCSTRCCILKLQVDLGANGLEELDRALAQIASGDRRWYKFASERPADSPRKGKCQACGGAVQPAPALATAV